MINKLYNRRFQFWKYRVSHGELLIRSPKSYENDTNIDFMFFSVEYVELPRFFEKVTLVEPTDEDFEYIKSRMTRPMRNNKIFVLMTENKKYYVVGIHLKVSENNLEFFELPFEMKGNFED